LASSVLHSFAIPVNSAENEMLRVGVGDGVGVGVGDGVGVGVGDGVGVGVGDGVGVGVEVGVGFFTTTPLFQTNFFPNLMHV